MKVRIEFDDGTEQVITGEVRYERTVSSEHPWSDVSIRIPNAKVVVGVGTPDQIELAPCYVCGAPQGPLVLADKSDSNQ